MKKIMIALLLTMSCLMPGWADTISYDKSDFAEVSTMIYDAAYDIRYYSANNFTATRITGYKAPRAYMTKKALAALAQAADDLRKQGYRILIWDTYRPQKAVDHFVSWINNPNNPGDKTFYPTLEKSNLLAGNYYYGQIRS